MPLKPRVQVWSWHETWSAIWRFYLALAETQRSVVLQLNVPADQALVLMNLLHHT